MENCSLHFIETIEGFIAMKDEWSRLHRRSVFPTVYNTWEWTFSCITGFEYKKICILSASDKLSEGDTPHLIIPFYIYKKGTMNFARIIGDEMADYCSFLIDKDINNLNLFYSAVQSIITRYKITRVLIKQIPDGFFNQSVLTDKHVHLKLLLIKKFGTSTYCADLSDTGTSGSISPKFLKSMKRLLLKLEDSGMKIYRCDSVTDDILNKFYALHRKKWGEKSAFINEGYRSFLKKLCELMQSMNQLRLHTIIKDNEPISFTISFRDSVRLYVYLMTFDARYSSHSVGTLLTHNDYLYCVENDIKCFDLLRGAEAYKKRWLTKETCTFDMNICVMNIQGLLFHFYDRLLGFIKKVYRFFRSRVTVKTSEEN